MHTAADEGYHALSLRARRQRRTALWVIAASAALIVVISVLNRMGFGGTTRSPLSDMGQYDRLTAQSPGVVAANCIRLPDGAAVRLMGTLPPRRAADSVQAEAYLRNRLYGKSITLRLEAAATRSADGELQAHVFADDRSLAIDMIREGLLRCDRQMKTAYQTVFAQTENAARKKKTGLWARGDMSQQ